MILIRDDDPSYIPHESRHITRISCVRAPPSRRESLFLFPPKKEESQTGNRILGADATQHLHPAVIALGDPAKDPHDNISQFCVSKKDHHSVSLLSQVHHRSCWLLNSRCPFFSLLSPRKPSSTLIERMSSLTPHPFQNESTKKIGWKILKLCNFLLSLYDRHYARTGVSPALLLRHQVEKGG